MKKHFALEKVLFSAAFIIMLVIPLLFTNTKANQFSKLEKRMLMQFPKLYDSDGNRNGNFLSEFELWFNDNVGLRDSLFDTNSKIQYDLFNNSAINNVVVGKDGWLFYNKANNVEIASNEYPGIEEEDLFIICNRQIEIKNKLEEKGIEYILCLPPSKVSIYPEYLKGNFAVTKTPCDIVADYLEEHSDIKVIRLKEALLKEKEKNPEDLLYFKTDTHWNAYGAYTAYKEMVGRMQQWDIIETEPVEVDYSNASEMRDLISMMVYDNEKYYEDALSSYSVKSPGAQIVLDGEERDFLSNYVQAKSISRADYYVNDRLSEPVFLVFGDSMFMEWLVPLMAENSSSIVGVWSFDIDDEIIDNVNPDVVFSELTERSISSLAFTSEEFINSR